MSFFDRLSDRVGDFLDEVMLPEEIHALHERARAAISRGAYDQALNWLGEAEHRRPGVERTRHMRALCHFYKEDFSTALTLFEEAIELREEASSHFYLGLTTEKLRRPQDAQAHFQRALQLDENPPFAFDLHFGLGRTYLALQRPARATRELRRALKLWPGQREAIVALAEALRLRGRFHEARELLEPITTEGFEIDGLLTLALVEAATGHPGPAAAAFEAILERAPNHRAALLEGARSYLAMGQMSRANQLLIRALGSVDGPDSAEIYALIGESNEGIHNLEKALQSYETALERSPDNELARIGAARVHLHQEHYRKAGAHFEVVLRSTARKHYPEALLGLGRCRLAEGDFAGARQLLEEAHQFFRSRPPELLHAIGAVALAEGDPAEALVAFRDALHAEPSRELSSQIEAQIEEALQALRPHFHLPQDFQSTADLLSTLRELKEALSGEPRLELFLSPLHELFTTLDSPLSVAILGEFNAGKSTLVNALLGEEVVPMGILPTTAHPCIMGYGPRKGARIVYNDGRLKDVDFATARTLMKAEADQIRRLEYTYPHPKLRSLHYWDTPGFNALDERHEALATEALYQAEAIVWILDANQALKETEFELLNTLEDSAQRVLLVLNKIDRLGSGDERQERVDEILDYLQKHTENQVVDILAISALEALKTTDESNQDFQTLLQLLDQRFAQRSWEIKISDVSRGLQRLLESIEDHRQDQLHYFHQLLEKASALSEFVEDASISPPEGLEDFASTFADRLEFLTLGLDREISDALRRQGRLIRKFILEEEDQYYILELFKERLDLLLDHFRRDFLQEISALEAELAARLSPLLSSLSVTDARPLRRRMEGFFDETRTLKTVLDERVFGQWRARALGQIATGGTAALEAITALGPDADAQTRRLHLQNLLPDTEEDFHQSLKAWQLEFLLSTRRFTARLHRDLATLELEVRHRLDFRPSP